MLPKKWFVIRNKDNYTVLNKWENEQNRHSSAYRKDHAYFFSDKPYRTEKDNKSDDYIEITFEDFKKYVLKEEITYEIY